MEKINKILKKIHNFLLAFAGISLALIVLATVISVIGRYFVKADLLPGVYNYIERIFFPVSTYCAFALSYREGMWPAMDVVLKKIEFTKAKAMKIIITVIEMIIYTVLTIFVFRYVTSAIQSGATILVDVNVLSMTPLLLLLLLAFILLVAESIMEFIRVLNADESNLLPILEED